MNASKVVASTGDPAFAVDLEGVFLAWNAAATRAFGYRRGEVLGRKCWQVLEGRDVYGNRYCGEHCPLRDHAPSGEPLHRSQMSFRTAADEPLQVSNCSLVVGGAARSRAQLVHIVRPVEPLAQSGAEVAVPRQGDADRVCLTDRQRQILRLLAEGQGTRAISEALGISVSTTRNHVQGILTRLKVHGRLEATVLARRLGLV